MFVGDSDFTAEALDQHGITDIINVGGAKIPYSSLLYQCHLSDDGENPRWMFTTILSRLNTVLSYSNSSRVLVCCRAGMSRSAFIIMLWLEGQGIPRNEACKFIKKKHPIAQVNLDLLRSV